MEDENQGEKATASPGKSIPKWSVWYLCVAILISSDKHYHHFTATIQDTGTTRVSQHPKLRIGRILLEQSFTAHTPN